jgi:DoxX-like family
MWETEYGVDSTQHVKMTLLLRTLAVLSSVLFLWYGLHSLLGDGMTADFARFGLSNYRRVTGGFEVLGALGVLAGLFVPPLMVVSAGGLSVLMLLGVITRVRVGDSWVHIVPALLLCLLNGYLSVAATRALPAAMT